MSASTNLVERFQELPRAVRWLALGIAFVVMFLAWDRTFGNLVRDWNQRAEAIERQVQAVTDSRELEQDLRELDDTIIGLGHIKTPGRENEARAALNSTVIEVLKNYTVSDDNLDISGGSDKLRENLSRGIARPGTRLVRLSGTLTFEASPADAIAIIADFERREDIEGVSSVRMNKGSGRKLRVSLTLEAWAESSTRKR